MKTYYLSQKEEEAEFLHNLYHEKKLKLLSLIVELLQENIYSFRIHKKINNPYILFYIMMNFDIDTKFYFINRDNIIKNF